MEVKGRKVKLSIWVSFGIGFLIILKADRLVVVVGHSRSRTFPHDHFVVLPRRTRDHLRSVFRASYLL